jgi:hypothetical protein
VVTAPLPVGEKDHQILKTEALTAAKEPIQEFVWAWVDQKFHSRKDLTLQIRFLNEPQIK